MNNGLGPLELPITVSAPHTCPSPLRGALTRLVAVIAAAVLTAPVLLFAGQSGASAATGVFTDAGSDLQVQSWADIETYGVDADTNRLDLSVGGPDLVDHHFDQDNTLIFRLDTDGDYDTDFSVIANGGTLDGVYAGEKYTSRLCPVSAKLSSTGAHVIAATRCVGNPASVHMAAVLISGRDTCGYGICYETSIDFAPDGHSNLSPGEWRFSPAVTVTAVPAPAPPVPAVNTTVKLTRIRYDAAGADTKANRNGEQVLITNTARSAVTLTGWTLRNASGHLYRFPTTRVTGRDTITVFTGRGTNTLRKRYWRSGSHVWNNTGRETATLKDSYGRRVDRCAWTAHPDGVKTC